jgi:phosphatidylglycerol:prolipoprotein diacylglycerol transferase
MSVAIDPIALVVFGVPVRWYGLFFALALAATWFAIRQKVNYAPTLTTDQVDRGMLWMSIGAVFGGRLGDTIFYSDQSIMDRLAQLPNFSDGGMSFHGGLIGVMIAVYLFSIRNNLQWQLADLTSCSAPIGLFLGRIGNLLNGEIYGPPTKSSFAFLVNGVSRYPTQLYESLLEGVMLFGILYFALPRYFKYQKALISSLFLILYAMIRFALDFIREEAVVRFGLKTSQILSIFMLIGGLALLFYSIRTRTSE